MNMESNEKPIINRIKVVLVEQRRTNKWLADTLGKDCTTVSKWCTNTVEKPLNFAPFGHAELSLLAKI